MARKMLEAHVSQERIPAVYTRVARVYDVWARLTETRARRTCRTAAGFIDVRRDALSQLGFPSEIVTARKAPAASVTPPR